MVNLSRWLTCGNFREEMPMDVKLEFRLVEHFIPSGSDSVEKTGSADFLLLANSFRHNAHIWPGFTSFFVSYFNWSAANKLIARKLFFCALYFLSKRIATRFLQMLIFGQEYRCVNVRQNSIPLVDAAISVHSIQSL